MSRYVIGMLRSVTEKLTRAALAPLGLTVQHISTVPTWDAFFVQLRKHNVDINAVFDIGVDEGTPELYDAFPKADLFLFDPTQRARRYMDELKARRAINAFSVALGDEKGKVVLRSGLGFPGGHGDTTLFSKSYATETTKTEVEIVRFDDLIRDVKKPALCKIDVQGAELMVLKGMVNRLIDIEYFIIETCIFTPFKGAPEFAEICGFMKDHGFVLYDIMSMQRRPLDGALGAIDAAFVHLNTPLRADPRWGSR